ncbi:DNA-3-methyladenine glycosylase [Lachnospiraceae bacterium KM106-2]|nr:DNA-3-methyladenine glycosylase [Lachnospiraceae bacterium KM106-2]
MGKCAWCLDGGIMEQYHDNEWGNILHDDQKHFEYLLMEVMQCGLNWNMMLKKREIFRECFAAFDYDQIAKFTEDDIVRILATEGMIKSRRKIQAIINNTNCFLKIRSEYGSFDQYLWSFSGNQTFVYRRHQEGYGEDKNELSDRISKDMKKRGFKYLGSITIYSHLQACGMINDHSYDCFKYDELIKQGNIKYF